MLPIRIQCGCGQQYEFEVEPVDRQMPSTVACPACGADGTTAANEAILQSMTPQAPAPAAGKAPLHLSTHSPTPARPDARRRTTLQHWQTDRTQAKFEAKARISWGDSPREVLGYLMTQGFNRDEASETVAELARERALVVRGKGIKNIAAGTGLILLPLVSLIVFLIIGAIPVKIFAFLIVGGFFGILLVIKGVHMLLAPKSEAGDVAEQ